LRVSAADISGNTGYWQSSGTNLELFMLEAFDQLPIKTASSLRGLNMIPDYINFLLEKWTKFGKRPNFLMVDGDNLSGFSFIISQLNSFTWINGIIKISGKTSEKVYWKSPDVTVTGGKFSFPYRGGERDNSFSFCSRIPVNSATHRSNRRNGNPRKLCDSGFACQSFRRDYRKLSF
jgi:hypothetical protein